MAVNIGVNIQRSANRIAQAVRESGVGGRYPELLLDFDDGYYRANGGSKPLSAVVTHTRAGNATMVDSDGLIKWAPHNLLRYSEDISAINWTSSNLLIDTNTNTAPDGQSTADKVTVSTTASAYIQVGTYTTALNTKYSHSVFIKVVSVVTPTIKFTNNFGDDIATFTNLDSTPVATNGIRGSSAGVDVLDNGWIRLRAVYTAPRSSTTTFRFSLPSATSGDEYLIWGAHLYRSDLGGMAPVPAGERVIPSASTYVPTTSSARYLPRVGHHVYNGSAWVNEGVLAESEPRTNLLPYSEDFTDADWTKGSVTLNPTAVVSPDGNTNGYKLNETSITVSSYFGIYEDISLTSGATVTLSVFAKAEERDYIALLVGPSFSYNGQYFNLSDGTKAGTEGSDFTSEIQDFGNGWYRCSVSYTPSATGIGFQRIIISNDGTNRAYAGTAGNGIYIYGAQLEAGSTPSSYIPTAGSTVTRAAETFLIPAANLPYSSVAMSIQMNGRMTYADNNLPSDVALGTAEAILTRWLASSTNYIGQAFSTNTGTGKFNFEQMAAGTLDFVISDANTLTPGILVPFNIASRHGMTFINGAVDGVALTEDTTPTNLPDLSATDLELAYDYMGTVETFRIWGVDLGDAGIEDATTGEPASYLIWDQANDDYVQRIFQ